MFFPFVSWGSYITHNIGKIISTAAFDSALARGQALSRIPWLCERIEVRGVLTEWPESGSRLCGFPSKRHCFVAVRSQATYLTSLCPSVPWFRVGLMIISSPQGCSEGIFSWKRHLEEGLAHSQFCFNFF